MKKTVRFVVGINIREGKYDAFEAIARAMAEGTSQEEGAVAYEFFVSADKKRARLYEEYRDASAAFAHLSGPVVTELVPQALAVADVGSFEVYGEPGPDATAVLSTFGAGAFAPLGGE